MKNVVEITRFKLKDGAEESEFLKASVQFLENFLKSQPGFVSRNLIRNSDGAWADLATWESMESAQAVEAEMMKNENAGVYCSFINMESMDMEHFCVEQ